ncbi:MAG: hypothetical protein JNM56_04505 [Planctomycetia bacterium]|nr:hypothetical protein [Planctomycetia bacterium]
MNPAQKLQARSLAVRVSFHWLGTKKTLTSHQIAKAAETFDADRHYLSATHKLFDTRHPAFKKVTAVKGDIVAYWRCQTLPFVEDGIRLMLKSKVEDFNAAMTEYRSQLKAAVQELDDHFHELRHEAKNRLGQLYHPDNYPESVIGTIDVEWSFPSVEPPDYLMQIQPALYEQEKQRVAARFEEAVSLAEAAFVKELQDLVQNLQERLKPGEDGKKKVFRDSTVGNFKDFFAKFRQLNVSDNQALDAVVQDAEALLDGVEPGDLRNLPTLRHEVTSGLAQIGDQLSALITTAPRRKIVRPHTNGVLTNGTPHNS